VSPVFGLVQLKVGGEANAVPAPATLAAPAMSNAPKLALINFTVLLLDVA
jgi:hypothetical protein